MQPRGYFCASIAKQVVCEHRLCLLFSIASVEGVNLAVPFGAEQDVALTVDREPKLDG